MRCRRVRLRGKLPIRRLALSWYVIIGMGVFGFSAVWAVDPDSKSEMGPLDLPASGGSHGDEDPDVIEPILFYGSVYEGDGYFFCIDRSGSMSEEGRLEQMKEEVISVIQSLTDVTEFSIVSFASGWTAWSNTPQEATTANRHTAEVWVRALEAGGTTCMGSAAVQTLNIAQLSEKEDKQVFVLSDGVPFCNGSFTGPQVLSAVIGANYERLPIHTIYISDDSAGVNFMTSLAMNGGTARTAGP